ALHVLHALAVGTVLACELDRPRRNVEPDEAAALLQARNQVQAPTRAATDFEHSARPRRVPLRGPECVEVELLRKPIGFAETITSKPATQFLSHIVAMHAPVPAEFALGHEAGRDPVSGTYCAFDRGGLAAVRTGTTPRHALEGAEQTFARSQHTK